MKNEKNLHPAVRNVRVKKDAAPTAQGDIAAVRRQLPELDTLFQLAELFKMFGDTTRIRIMCCLFQKELCVGDLAELLEMGQSAISHQLRLLRGAHLVKVRRDGKQSYYSLDDAHVREIYLMGLEHVNES